MPLHLGARQDGGFSDDKRRVRCIAVGATLSVRFVGWPKEGEHHQRACLGWKGGGRGCHEERWVR